jgi:hypothetical protein
VTFEQGDVVRVPFPYADRPVKQHWPALVVSRGGIGYKFQVLTTRTAAPAGAAVIFVSDEFPPQPLASISKFASVSRALISAE